MTGVVLDTNILISANLNGGGLKSLVVSLALAGVLKLYPSKAVLAEYERVLHYPRLKFLPEETNRFIHRVRQAGTLVYPTEIVTKAPHEPDNRFLECAQAVVADSLVTAISATSPTPGKAPESSTAASCAKLLLSSSAATCKFSYAPQNNHVPSQTRFRAPSRPGL